MRFLALATPLLVLFVLPALDHLEEWSGGGRPHSTSRRTPRPSDSEGRA
jgi:hypothetical protein